jgi:hypothetical protein
MTSPPQKQSTPELRCEFLQQLLDYGSRTPSQPSDREILKSGEHIELERRFAELRGKFEASEARVLHLEAALSRLHVEAALLSAEEKKASEEHETEVRAFATLQPGPRT